MKTIKILLAISTLLFTNPGFAEEEQTPPLAVTPMQVVQNETIDLENLPKESIVGSLAEVVKDEESLLDSLEERIHYNSMLYPYSEQLAFVNGFLCHIGYYPRSIVYTMLDGPQYGIQTVTKRNGKVLYVNYDYSVEFTPYGTILYHYYDDSKIITGSTQVISFY